MTQGIKTPTKEINGGDDLTFFQSSKAYRDLITWLLQLNRSMFPAKDENGTIHEAKLDSPPAYSHPVQSLRSLISTLSALIDQAPPDQGPRRFGNVAFRTWFKLVEDAAADGLLESHLKEAVIELGPEAWTQLVKEFKYYLLGSFGSAQRLDYGTGHELSFLAFLGCLWKVGVFEAGDERSIVIGVVQPYLELIRRLVLTYTLEPAGSHGVWGLDDHSFLPYIFGAAQYGPAIDPTKASSPVPTEGSLPSAPRPTAVTDKTLVSDYQHANMYFSAIQFIYDVKRGPFWEHSPVLYDISGIKDGWAKINKGMLKMYAAEVLGKFPVVQHFGFGGLFRWELDPDAAKAQGGVHSAQQPQVQKGRKADGPAAASGGEGTKAPRANAGNAATGTAMPSTRAPWASSGGGQSTAPRTAAPWAASQRMASNPSRLPPPTKAPWAGKDTG
ncbi:Phosphotyrosyl phosphate activator protein-domain-containing protein [Neohortaea acidophila]|uniref:Serine/threonine-protein phosphatase 2A activator n=1 Tax=Neohortaea acidophila TaxID=245834 RepID=A0A6A6PT80_9PEZI|nr:Phosphotyrosyl phosphate activator protein-domain-containing protein [Neohortaea acidophila]KAF2482437.1 Phosphotyrosyl phosphate activator protein-domain-containing protein [Neohortaea acidophila]